MSCKHDRHSTTWNLVGSLLLIFTASLGALAQQDSRASLGGKVKDPSGAVIGRATVVVTAQDTGVKQTTRTDSTGDWVVRFLVPGIYRFEVNAQGFKRTEHTDIELRVADQKYVDTELTLGSNTETVEVQTTQPLIDTSSAVSGTVVTDAEIEQLPTQSNAPTMFVGLTPGAIVSGGVGGGVFLWSNGGLSGTNVDGTGGNAVNYSIDGAVDSTNGGQLAFEPPLDAVAEFKVVTNAYDAAIGRQSAATINLALKSGADKFHGDLYEDNQNNFLNANRYENKPPKGVPPVHYNQYGGSVGGPIWIPKLYDGRNKKSFFFFTFAAIRNRQPANTGYMSIPTLLERKGDFSQSYTTQTVAGVTKVYPVQIYDPATYNAATKTRTQFSSGGVLNVIPSSRIDPVATALLNMIPAPDTAGDGANSDSNNYLKREVQDDQFHSMTLRTDQAWNAANHSYVDLRYNIFHELSYDPFGPTNLLQGLYQRRLNRGITIDHSLVVNEHTALDLRYNVTRYEGSSYDPSAGVSPTTIGLPASFAGQQQLPSILGFTGITTGYEDGGLGTTQAQQYSNDTNQQYTANLTQTVRSHTLRYGYELLLQQQGAGALDSSGGNFNFGNNWTTQNPDAAAGLGVGSNIASMLLGLPTSGSLPTKATAFYSQHFQGVYFQDDWRTTSKLTLNFGLRWDYERPVTDRFNRFNNRFDPTLVIAPVTSVSQPAYAAEIAAPSTNAGIQLLQQFRPDAGTFITRGGVEYAGLNGTSVYTVNPRYKYFQPRIGFAYALYPNIVVRGGLGRFVQATFYTPASQSGYSASTPFIATNDNYHTINATLDNPFAQGLVPITGNALGTLTNVGSTSSYIDPNIGRPYTDQASAYLQHQIGSFLLEYGGTLNISHGQSIYDPSNGNNNGYNINNPSYAAWKAAFSPTFDATGRPNDTLPGNVQVANPFKGAPYITNGVQTASTIGAFQLLRPTPVEGSILLNQGNGKQIYYALNTKIEKRFQHGFSLLQAFTWSKRISENNFIGNQNAAQIIERRLDTGDQRFHLTVTPVYELPFGRGKRFGGNVNHLLDQLIGGYEVSGIYTFLSGTPLNFATSGSLATNGAFFQGGTPALATGKSKTHWFDTSKFAPFPSRNTTVATLRSYPGWTGVQNLPGYSYVPTNPNDATKNGVYQDFGTYTTYNQTTFGDVRNPYTTDFTLGVRKAFAITSTVKMQLRLDAFNALNHPRFGNFDVTPGDSLFGYASGSTTPSQVNAPRQIQLSGRFSF